MFSFLLIYLYIATFQKHSVNHLSGASKILLFRLCTIHFEFWVILEEKNFFYFKYGFSDLVSYFGYFLAYPLNRTRNSILWCSHQPKNQKYEVKQCDLSAYKLLVCNVQFIDGTKLVELNPWEVVQHWILFFRIDVNGWTFNSFNLLKFHTNFGS